MSRLVVYDNCGKLVGAVIDRERLQELARCDSLSSRSSSSAASISRLSSLNPSFNQVDTLVAYIVANELDQVTTTTQANGRGGGVAAFLFARPLAYYRRKKLQEYDRRLQQKCDLYVSKYISHISVDQLDQLERFSLRELKLATENFSNKNIIGRGGFGKVYKGQLADGSLVAVKRLKEKRTLGGELQFLTEVEMEICSGKHPSILKLHGFCLTLTETILVYPYMAKGSVASCLRERAESQPPLDWPTRERIALSAAKGLVYMHYQCNPRVIHRDVKAANLLLNEDFEAVIGDFGLAEFMDSEDAHLSTDVEAAVIFDFGLAKLMDPEDTHVTTGVCGTMGHIAPEYLSTGKASEKIDVFAYGVTLLELITGQRAFDLARLANDDDVMLLDWVKGLLKAKKLEALVDADLEGNYIDEKVEKLIQLALLCCQFSPKERPKMSDVVQMLQEDDGLAERWLKFQEDEWYRREFNHIHHEPNTDYCRFWWSL